MKLWLVALLLSGSATGVSTAAAAQERSVDTETTQDTQARIDALQAQVEALQASIDQLKAQVTKAAPSWKGAPLNEDKTAGFSFKPKGAIQYDAGYVGFPDGHDLNGTVGGLNYNNLGWNSRARRLLLGADGTLPGGFRYSAEFNFGQGQVDYEDIFIAYDFKSVPLTVQVGNIYPFSSLETLTSSKFTSFMERATFTDAFSLNRRLGIGLTLSDRKSDSWLLQAGIFNKEINDNTSFNRTGYEAAIRGVYSPMLGATRLHLGASAHYRVNNKDAQNERLRARPLTQVTDQRFVDTNAIAARSDTQVGVEFAAIRKGLHLAAEAQKLWVNAIEPGDTFGPNNGTGGGALLDGDPSFWGGYAEVGVFLTGETRGYKNGRFDRTKVLRPLNDGGWGALQLNGRVDWLELRDRVEDGSGPLAPPSYVNGGKQIAYQASLIWNPTDYLRLVAQYGHINLTGGPRAVAPLFDPNDLTPVNKRKFDVDTATVRAQVDF